jgi:hypothetical protein
MCPVPPVLIIKEFKMSKPFVLGFIVGVALLIVAGVGASRLQRRDANRVEADAEEKEYQAKIVDATPVQLGALSEKQRVHSKLYSHYREIRQGTISGLVAQAKGKSRIARTITEVGLGPALIEPETPEKYFGKLAEASDTVIRGRVTKKASLITEDDAYIFTDYELVVTEVLKNTATSPIDTGTTITVTRPGGTVLLDGLIVEAVDMSFEPLPINNHEVVLFLRFIPETGAYKATRDTGSFELDGSILRPLGGSGFPPGVVRDKDSFLKTVRAISNQ